MSYKTGDVVANNKHQTVGVVLDVFDRGDIRTDADGVVYGGDCELYSAERHAKYHIAPSTAKQVSNKV